MQPARAQSQTAIPQTSYLDAIADLTATRDSYALAHALVANLNRFIAADRIELFGLCNDTNDREFNLTNLDTAVMRNLLAPQIDNARAVLDDEDVRTCIVSQRATARIVAPQCERQVLPVFGVRDLSAVLVFEGPPLDSEALALTRYLLRIYSNQVILMGKGEFDALTGLLNRQAFDERMKKLMGGDGAIGRDGETLDAMCFAILDIDHFKQVNDRYGHLFGDEVLLLFARLMTQSFRQCDMLFRYGGEEFAVVLGHKLDRSLTALERFRTKVENFDFPQVGKKTISIGVVEIDRRELVSTIIDKADRALYYAKNSGRNRLCAYETLRAAGLVTDARADGGEVELF